MFHQSFEKVLCVYASIFVVSGERKCVGRSLSEMSNGEMDIDDDLHSSEPQLKRRRPGRPPSSSSRARPSSEPSRARRRGPQGRGGSNSSTSVASGSSNTKSTRGRGRGSRRPRGGGSSQSRSSRSAEVRDTSTLSQPSSVSG